MNQLISLVKRNIKIFLRDKTAVFFSFLSVIILLLLYFLFLNNTYKNGLPETLTRQEVQLLSTNQMMGGVLVINTMTLSLGMMGNIVNDRYFKKTESFLITPVKRVTVTMSYFLSTVIITFILSLLMWVLTIAYLFISTGFFFSFATIILVTLLLLLYTFISATMMMLLISFIKSASAFGAISGVLGTFVGFISGIYMPLSILPTAIQYIASINPFTHMAITLKSLMMAEPLELVKDKLNAAGIEALKSSYGLNEIGIFGQKVPMVVIFIAIALIASILFLITVKRMAKKS